MTPEGLYNILTKFAHKQGIELNADREHVMAIMEGLLKNEARYGYRSCPCRLATGLMDKDRDIICPCRYKDADIEQYGSCYCHLYVSDAWNKGDIPHVQVPERRPLEKRV